MLSILIEPHIKRLQLGIEGSREFNIARRAKIFFEVPLELKHVAEIVGAGKAQAPENRRIDFAIAHRLSKRTRHLFGHFLAGEMLAGDPGGLSDEGIAAFENAIRAFADVLGCDPGQFFISHRNGKGKRAVFIALGPEAK